MPANDEQATFVRVDERRADKLIREPSLLARYQFENAARADQQARRNSRVFGLQGEVGPRMVTGRRIK